MNTIIIRDCNYNGKNNILDYSLFLLNDIYIVDNKLICNNIDILKNVKNVIFDFNESLLFFPPVVRNRFKNKNNMKQFIIKIAGIIKKIYKKICIYNDPNKCYILGDKYLQYDFLTSSLGESKIINIPKYKNINVNNYNKETIHFPAFFREICGSCSKNDFIAYNDNDVEKHLKQNVNYIASDFINSYIPELNCNNMIRFLVINNKLIDYHFICSNKKNIHPKDQIPDLINKGDIYFKNELMRLNINEFCNQINKIFGNGFYAIDCVYGSNGKLYLCEIGLKFFMGEYVSFLSKKGINLNKVSLNKNKLISIQKKILS